MTSPDLNLLFALDVLLTEGSVARAANRLRLSPSAMSRTLARLRQATGDPLLVRSGRGLVATPRAEELRQLRDVAIDLDIGVAGETGPEVRIQALLRDRFIGAVRMGHPLSEGTVTPERYAAGRHISVSRRGREKGPIDEALNRLGLQRTIVCMVSGFSAALAMARTSDLIASVPERHTEGARVGMHSFALPVATAGVTISMLWHPRLDADPAQRWLRDCVREICAASR
ncbi:LysR family transcriptional regulator [Mesorhizobium sp. M0243]|uniref:LysR family transcriptional regulator n=1 Tax=Mesorhizobium sp. M0243 TaxID=2956925 RepID=UPI00333B9A28